MVRIDSPKNPLVKQAAALLDPHGRRKRGRLLLEGPKAIEDALASGARFERAFVGPGFGEPVRERLERARVAVHEVAPRILASLCGTEAPQGIVAVAHEPAADAAEVFSATTLAPLAILDGVQDPGNLGTIVRTAAALGFRGALLTPGTADPFAPKAARASAGTLFRFPLVRAEAAPPPAGFFVVAAAAGGAPPEEAFAAAAASGKPVALAVGNEGQGLGPALLAAAHARVWVPIARSVESLNVAAAFAILGYALTRASGR